MMGPVSTLEVHSHRMHTEHSYTVRAWIMSPGDHRPTGELFFQASGAQWALQVA
jgi:hypothetical protein